MRKAAEPEAVRAVIGRGRVHTPLPLPKHGHLVRLDLWVGGEEVDPLEGKLPLLLREDQNIDPGLEARRVDGVEHRPESSGEGPLEESADLAVKAVAPLAGEVARVAKVLLLGLVLVAGPPESGNHVVVAGLVLIGPKYGQAAAGHLHGAEEGKFLGGMVEEPEAPWGPLNPVQVALAADGGLDRRVGRKGTLEHG